MFDDLIPQQAAPAPVAPPPGMFDDLIPTAGAGSTELVSTTPAQGDHPARVTIGTNPQAPPSAMHGFRVGAQGVAKGLLHTAAMPFDLMAGAQNLVTGGINKVFGTEIPQATPASQLAEQAAAPIMVPPSEMSPQERLVENISDFGTQGLGMGAMLAARAPTVLANAITPAKDIATRSLDAMARPYASAPARTVTGDAIAGAGSGVGVTAQQDYAPDSKVAQVLAPLAGGVGAAGLQGLAEGIGGLIRNLFNRRADVNVPASPSGAPYTVADTNRAASQFQEQTRGAPRAVAQDIRENATELTNPTQPGEVPIAPSAIPTSGMLSRDIGLVQAEQQARLKGNQPFIERDQNVKGAAADQVAGMRDPNADQGAVPRAVANARETQIAPLDQRVQQFDDVNRRVDQTRQQQGAEFGAVANTNAQATASRNLDRAVVDQNYIPARAEKNRQFDTAPGRTEQLPADDIFDAIDRVRAGANGLAPGTLPNDFMRRIDELRPRIDPETGDNIGGPGTARGGDLADLRKFIGPAREQAQRSGNFDLADNLGRLQRSINSTITEAPGYAEANANYHQFADRFRPERNDEGAKFTKEIDRGGQQPDGTLNRGSTPPSATADRFLKSPEKAQALNRMLAGAPSEQAGQTAIRDYMRSDFAMAVMNPDGSINPARAAAWGRNNADVLAQFPNLQQEFAGIQQAAQRGEQLSTDARAFLDQARRTRDTQAEAFDRSAAGTLLREDPRDVAASILGGNYGAERRLGEINNVLKNDEAAQRGWKAAFAEVLADKVTGTKQVGEQNYEVLYARLASEFKNNENTLAKVYSPEEMNTLRQAHKMLGYFKEAEKRATVGSQTAERVLPQWFQLGLRHIYGDIKGGGVAKRLKLMLELLPSNKQSANEIMNQAWFDPNVAAYLLEKPVADKLTLQYNSRLQRVIAVANAARGENGNGDKH